MGEPFYIRPSTVAGAMLCPARSGLYGHVDYQYYPNEGLFFGSVVHFGIEHILTHGQMDGIEHILLDAMPDIWAKDAEGAPDEFGRVDLGKVMTRSQRVALMAEVVVALEKWLDVPFLTLRESSVLDVERTIERSVGFHGDIEVIMRGTPDLIRRTAHGSEIIDWKTAGKNWDKHKMSSQFQRIAYPWMDIEDGGVMAWFTYWVYDRTAKWWVKHPAPPIRDEEIYALVAQTMAVAGSMIEHTWTYSPTGQGWGGERGWHCSPKYCNAWNACDGRHLVLDDKVDLTVPSLKERMEK